MYNGEIYTHVCLNAGIFDVQLVRGTNTHLPFLASASFCFRPALRALFLAFFFSASDKPAIYRHQCMFKYLEVVKKKIVRMIN